MGKYFGTDGIRGEFGVVLTEELVVKVAKAAAVVFGSNANICIGMDPRQSSKTIENLLIENLCSAGVNVTVFDVVSTPVVSLAITSGNYDAGIMISASHNPYIDNGIKFFGADGKKLSDALEEAIEVEIEKASKPISLLCEVKYDKTTIEKYIDYLVAIGTDLTGVRLGLDCANGSASSIAPIIFEKLGADVHVIANQPDGININDGVGSTHPEALSEFVLKNNLDYGFAFDGDADRIMLVDANGEVLDGDYIIYLIAKKLKECGTLTHNLVISTVMANLGFNKAMDHLGIKTYETAVGDRFVMQAISEFNAVIGGEQSGHIILPEFLPTGDGILTAVYLSKIFMENKTQLQTLKDELVKYPQSLVNLKVADKNVVMDSPQLKEIIAKQEEIIKGNGRILVRTSGTESLVRVMVEAKTIEMCDEISKPIIDIIEKI